LRVFVNLAIIHNNNGIGGRIWLHIVKKSFDKMTESVNTVGAFDDVTVKDAAQREGRKD
jgi:hypothetical protein